MTPRTTDSEPPSFGNDQECPTCGTPIRLVSVAGPSVAHARPCGHAIHPMQGRSKREGG